MKTATTRHAPARPPEPDLSLNETAYLRLKEALVTLAYKPGEYFNAAQVMERFGVGRTPVNQALHPVGVTGVGAWSAPRTSTTWR